VILDRTHRKWLLVSLVLLGAGTATYVAYASGPSGTSGGSLPGMLYGLAGTAMMIFAGLLSARRQVPTWRIGSAQFWMRGHLWLGLLSVPFLLFHAGFRWGGPVEIGIWLTIGMVIVSGIVGLAFQQVLPRLLTARVPNETFVDQVPYQCSSAVDVAEDVARQRKWLKRESDLQKIVDAIYVTPPQLGSEQPAKDPPNQPAGAKAAATSSPSRQVIRTEELKVFFLKTVRPFLSVNSSSRFPLARSDRRRAAFEHMRVVLPAELHETLDQLEQFCEQRSQLHQLTAIHRWLHGWLYLHVPISAALLVLFVFHVVISLRVVPWEW